MAQLNLAAPLKFFFYLVGPNLRRLDLVVPLKKKSLCQQPDLVAVDVVRQPWAGPSYPLTKRRPYLFAPLKKKLVGG